MMLGAVAGLIGPVVSAVGAASAASDQAAVKDAEAQEQRRKGLQENAAKQREASDREKERDKILSDQRAGLASSGGGVDVGSAFGLQIETAKRGNYNRDQTLWEGAEAQAGREAQARILEMEGDNLRKAGKMQALSSVVGGVSGVFKGAGGGGSSGGHFYG